MKGNMNSLKINPTSPGKIQEFFTQIAFEREYLQSPLSHLMAMYFCDVYFYELVTS